MRAEVQQINFLVKHDIATVLSEGCLNIFGRRLDRRPRRKRDGRVQRRKGRVGQVDIEVDDAPPRCREAPGSGRDIGRHGALEVGAQRLGDFPEHPLRDDVYRRCEFFGAGDICGDHVSGLLIRLSNPA